MLVKMELWQDLCRCCLAANSQVIITNTENDNIADKFLEITTVQVQENDGLPQKLCDDCYNILNTSFQFRTQSIKMNDELKVQLQEYLENEGNIDKEIKKETHTTGNNEDDDDDFGSNPMKQLEAIIKSEPQDPDDDYYYVLVIDEKDKEKSKISEEIPLKNIKQEAEETTENTQETNLNIDDADKTEEQQNSGNHFSNSMNSFLLSDTRVPDDVPATILENEEELDNEEDNAMDIDEQLSQDTISDNNLEENSKSTNKGGGITKNFKDITNNQNLIKIIGTPGSDGSILLKTEDGIEYLADTQIVTDEDGEPLPQEQQVIVWEGEESSQFQILKCDGSELVIEYADDCQLATVVQQEDCTFLCDCGQQFDDLAEFEKHQVQHNPGELHLCNLCGKGFESPEILMGHKTLHSVTGMLVKCMFCDQLLKRSVLTQHIKYNHNKVKPSCNVCFKTFANPNNLKRHMMIHNGVKEFQCDVCFKKFHQKITMQTHRLTHVNPFCCTECGEDYQNKQGLDLHRKSNECTKSKVLESRQKVKEELLKTVKQQVTSHNGKVLGYACSLCKKMFSLESALEEHVEATHLLDPSELLCPDCGEVSTSKKEMQSHLMTHKHYKARQDKRFACGICGKGCSSQAMLVMHERVHTNERPFPCQLCSLSFKTRTHLRTHQLTHTREKKFGCSVCMKFFALKGNLVVHLRTHTGERPYACSLCDETFIDSKYLKKHKLKKHAIENVPWNQY